MLSIKSFALVFVVAALAAPAQAKKLSGFRLPTSTTCLNNTGGCHLDGTFECLDGSKVSWKHRCDNKADCEDGMDEYLCGSRHGKGHEAHEQMSCGPTCACQVTTTTLMAGSTFWNQALSSPVWGGLLAGTPLPGTNTYGCNKVGGKTLSVVIDAYKKGSSTCVGNVKRRGFLCCIRQTTCNCAGGTTGIRCA